MAYKLPSSIGVSQSFDNDENRLTALDFNVGTNFYAMLSAGASFSKMKYDDDNDGQINSYYVGIQSNPLRDWIFGTQFQYTRVSDQMRIFNPSVSVQRYFNRFDIKLDVGYRIIESELTPALMFFLQSGDDNVEDENFWWNLSTHIEPFRDFVVGISYLQYQYSTPFEFFTRPTAQVLGYTLDTINYGSSFADYIYSVNGTFYRNRWDFTLDYTYVKNQFEEAATYTWTPSVGFHLNKRWFFSASMGLSRGVTEGEEDRTGGFLTLGTTFSF